MRFLHQFPVVVYGGCIFFSDNCQKIKTGGWPFIRANSIILLISDILSYFSSKDRHRKRKWEKENSFTVRKVSDSRAFSALL